MRVLSLLAAGAGLASAQQFDLKYWTDGNCTTPHVGTGALNTTQLAIAAPMDQCVNSTATSGVGNFYVANGLRAGWVASSSCVGNNYTMAWNTAETCWPSMAIPPGAVSGGLGCKASTSVPGAYYTASCSTSTPYSGGDLASITITTTFAPMSDGSWSIKYYNDALCTQGWNISGVDVELAGPMHQCINVTATGSPLSASYKAVDVRDCTGSLMTMNLNLAAHECPATVPAPAIVNTCSWSTSFSKYYMAQCSATAWAGDTTRIMTTTFAPISTGNWTLKYYNEANCTTPWTLSGAAVEIEGPMGKCVNVTASGSPLVASYKSVDYHTCNGATATMSLNLAAETCASGLVDAPVTVGTCAWSASFSKYYISTCNADGWAGASTLVITTTHAPISAGTWNIQYYDDAQCTTPWLLNGASVNLGGPMGQCINVTATGSPLVASYKAADFGACNGATATMNINLAAETCETGLMPVPVAMNWCSWSTSFSKYFISTCSNATYSGTDHTIATSAPTTSAPVGNTTTVAVGNTTAPTTAPPGTATVKVQASYEAVENLPATITGAELLASVPYMAAKKTGLAGALVVPEADITIDGFSISRRRLANKGRALASKTVVTSYSVDVPATAAATMQAAVVAGTLAAAIQTQTATAMAAQDWSAEPVLSSAPTLTVSSTTYIGTATTAPPAAPGTSSAFGIAAFGLGAIAMLF